MEYMTECDIDEAVQMVEEAIDEFDEAMYSLSKIQRLLEQKGETIIALRLQRYTMGNICSFIDEGNEHQIGNLRSDIIPSIEELRRPCDEDLRQIGYDWSRDQTHMSIDELKSGASTYAVDLGSGTRPNDHYVAEMIHEGIQDRIQELEGKEFEKQKV